MKKLILIIVVLFLAQTASKHPYFEGMLGRLENQIITEASTTLGITKTLRMKKDLGQISPHLTQQEVNYLSKNIMTMDNAQSFSQSYCVSHYNLRHSVLTKSTIERTCNILGQYLKE